MGGRWRVTANRYGVSYGGDDENALKLIVRVAQLCEYPKNHWILYLNWVNCVVC